MAVAAVLPLEDAVRGEQAQDPVERVRVSSAGRCQLADRHGLIPDAVGNSQIGYDMQTPGRKTSSGKCPDDGVGRWLLL